MSEALARGVVHAGGSAGGIVWFDGGHSDSMDPDTYKNPPGRMLNPACTPEQMSNWAYIRVPGLSLLPGLFCPHYDKVQSNGVLRATDFTSMLQQHAGETGIAVDDFAALVVDGVSYSIVSTPGYPGSNRNGTFTSDRSGIPAVWKLNIDTTTGQLERTLVEGTGLVQDLLTPARYIVQSSMLPVAMSQNPDDGMPSGSQCSSPTPSDDDTGLTTAGVALGVGIGVVGAGLVGMVAYVALKKPAAAGQKLREPLV
jgi:dipeptidase E